MKRVVLLIVIAVVLLSACSSSTDGVPKDAILDENNELNLLGSILTDEKFHEGLSNPKLVEIIKRFPVGTKIGLEGYAEVFEAKSNQVYLNYKILPVVTPGNEIGYIKIVLEDSGALSYEVVDPVPAEKDGLHVLLKALPNRRFAIVYCEGNKYAIDVEFDSLHVLGGKYPYRIINEQNHLGIRYRTDYNVIGYDYFNQKNVLEVTEEYKNN